MHSINWIVVSAFALVSCSNPSVVPNSRSDGANEDVVVSDAALSEGKNKFASAFIGNCVLNMPATNKVKAYASVADWKPLSEEMKQIFGPAEPGLTMEGWQVVRADMMYFVGLTEGSVEDELHKTCAHVFNASDSEAIVQEVVSTIANGAQPILSEVEAGQRFRIWRYEYLGTKFRLIVTDAPSMAPGIVTLASNYSQKL